MSGDLNGEYPKPQKKYSPLRKLLPPLSLVPAAAIILASALWLIAQGGAAVASRISVGLEHPYFQLDNEEGALLAQVLDLKKGRLPYRPIEDYPFVVGTYPPVYLFAASLLTSTELPSLWGGRAVSAVGLLLTLIGLAVASGCGARSVLAPLVALGLYLATFEVYSWAPYFRADFLACGLSLVGLAVVLSLPTRRSLWLAAILFALAFYTKQTSVSAPVATSVALWFCDRSAARRFLWLAVSAVSIPFILLTVVTKGQFFLHTVTYNANKMNWGDVIVWARHLWRLYPFLLGLLGATVALVAFQKKMFMSASEQGPSKDEPILGARSKESDCDTSNGTCTQEYLLNLSQLSVRRRFAGAVSITYFMISLINVIAIAKSGSAENYLLEPLAAVSLLVSVVIGTLLRSPVIFESVTFHPVHLLAILLLCHSISIGHLRPIWAGKEPSPDDFKNAAFVTQRLRAAEPPVLCELACYTVFAGKEVLFQPFIMSELARQGKWSEEPFVHDLSNGRYSLIITSVDLQSEAYTDAFTPRMREEIRRNYRLQTKLENGRLWRYYLYVPQSVNLAATQGTSNSWLR